jgi:arylsulfatase A-like enzyme/Tfp pilus assembly protein PilF
MPSAPKRAVPSPTPPAALRAAGGNDRRRLLAPLIVVVVAAGCVSSGRPALHRGALGGYNVLLVTIDTLRVDRVGAYGNRAGLTPTLDRLAASGVRYAHAYSHVPMTLPAHTSILTGLTPPRSGVRNNTTFKLDEHVPTLATFLKRGGYRTGAFIGAFVLDARFGLARDFDEYDDRLPHTGQASFHFAERRGADVVKAAGDWITTATQPTALSHQPWFAWVHLFDPHAPYDAPAEYRAGRSPYDAEVAYADAMVGALLTRLAAAGQMDRTLVVVTSDHGESLGEHGETTHGLFAYDSTVRVPFVLNAPGIGPAVVDLPVAHTDIVPTILDLTGADVPGDLDGRSLVGDTDSGRALYIEALDASLTRGWAPLTGVVQNGWKYIDLPDAELYDLTADAGEQRNRMGEDAGGRVGALRRTLEQFSAGRGRAAPTTALDRLDKHDRLDSLDRDAAARLRSLGYVGGSSASRTPPTLADDPKRLVSLNERFNSALTDFEEGRPSEALALLTSVLAARPDFMSARTSAATVLLSVGRSRDAVQMLREAPPAQAESPEILSRLGAALRDAGDLRGAATTLDQARRSGDGSPDLLQDLAVVDAALGRSDAARALFEQLTKQNPTAATAWYNLGLFELQSGRPTAAVDALRHAVDREPTYGDAWHALGAALAKQDPAAAIDAWRRAERLLPRDYDLLFNLGMLAAGSGTPSDAIPYLRRFANEAPPERYARDIAAVKQALARLERGAP